MNKLASLILLVLFFITMHLTIENRRLMEGVYNAYDNWHLDKEVKFYENKYSVQFIRWLCVLILD